MAQCGHQIKMSLPCFGLGLLLLLTAGSGYARATGPEEQGIQQQESTEQHAATVQHQAAAEGQNSKPRADTQGQVAQPQGATKEVPGPIRFELTSRAELKYEHIMYEASGHTHRILLSGSYVFSNMSVGIDELPMLKIDTPGRSEEDYRLGDVILRWGYVPYIAPSQDFGVIFATHLTLPTGDFEEGAGAGRYDLEPRLFLPYKVNRMLTIVPAIYQKFTLEKKERLAQDSALLTLRLLNIIYPVPGSYLIVDPRFYYDFETEKGSGELRFAFGSMLTKNMTAFLEYSAGLGGHRPFEGKAACGLRYFFR